MLGELAEHALMVSKDLAVRVRECEDTGEAVALAGAFQKMSRVVRLTLALDFKLDRDAARDAREAKMAQAELASAPPPAPAGAHKLKPPGADPVGEELDRLFWAESEGDEEEFERLHEDLEERMTEAISNPDFKDTPVDAMIEQVIADMGLASRLKVRLHDPSLPRKAAGRGPSAPRRKPGEEPMVEGAGRKLNGSTGPP
jgi:hypothetical protein